MLLSDRDLRTEIAGGRVVLDPYDDALVQPSSIDVRLDRFFRVFNNHLYTHIDPAEQQDDLTAIVEATAERNGRSHRSRATHIWHVTDGKATEFWGTSTDPYGDDEFWS